MAEFDNSKRANKIYTWLKNVISQVDIDEPKVSDFNGVTPEQKASLLLGEGLANEQLANLNSLYRKDKKGYANFSGAKQTYIVDSKGRTNNTKQRKVSYISKERESL